MTQRDPIDAASGLHAHKVTVMVEDNKLSEIERAVAKVRKLGAPDHAKFRHEDMCLVFEWGETV